MKQDAAKSEYQEVDQLAHELTKYCKAHKIPIFISAYNEDAERYVNYTVTPTELHMQLPDDKYPEFLRVLTGFNFDNYQD